MRVASVPVTIMTSLLLAASAGRDDGPRRRVAGDRDDVAQTAGAARAAALQLFPVVSPHRDRVEAVQHGRGAHLDLAGHQAKIGAV